MHQNSARILLTVPVVLATFCLHISPYIPVEVCCRRVVLPASDILQLAMLGPPLSRSLLHITTTMSFAALNLLQSMTRGMGGWKISRVQRDLVLDLFEGLIPSFRIRSNEGWSRGRKSLHEKLVNLTDNPHIRIGGTIDTSHVAATSIIPDMISMPSNAGILDPRDFLAPLQCDTFFRT